MAPLFPAILVGGSSATRTSQLVYELSRWLAEQALVHYVLRTSSAGISGWGHTRLPASRAALYNAGVPARLLDATAIRARHVPLLVDAGGLLTPPRAALAAACTHYLLLTNHTETVADWEALSARYGLVPLHHTRYGHQSASTSINESVLLCLLFIELVHVLGTDPPSVNDLLHRTRQICHYSLDEHYRAHLATSKLDLVIHLEQAIYPLPAHSDGRWQPSELTILLASLPAGEPLAIYGRGPAWVYGALAIVSAPAQSELFDAYEGWVTLPMLAIGLVAADSPVCCEIWSPEAGIVHLHISLRNGLIERRSAAKLRLPALPTDRGLIVHGDLPGWLWAALARTYAPIVPWLAFADPADSTAVIIHSNRPDPTISQVYPLNVK